MTSPPKTSTISFSIVVKLTFYGGIEEIGGNQILLEDADTRLFFDFGLPFGRRSLYFEEYLNPRPGAGLLDVLEMGLLPPLRGIYREDLLPDKSLWQRFESSPLYRRLKNLDGVLLSHAHLDHSGYISFLRPEIPIYSTSLTAFVAKAMQDSSPSNFEKEVCYANLRKLEGGYLRVQGNYTRRPFVFLDNPQLSEEAEGFWNSSPVKHKALEFLPAPTEKERIGNLRIKFFSVDHSIPGACAFAVETSSGWIVYTGDLRFKGKKAQDTKRFVTEAQKLRPYLLLCEGTRAGETGSVSEEEVYENALEAVKKEKGLVIADFGPRHVERLLTFLRIAQETERKLLILAKDAYLFEAMQLLSPKLSPLGEQEALLIYQDLKSRLAAWEESLHQHFPGKLVSSAEVQKNPQNFILCFSFWDLDELVDIVPQGGTYIYSSSEVFDEEGALDMKRLHNWIRHFELKGIGLPRENLGWKVPEGEQGLHASGHASGPELLELAREIRPQVLLPIHTEKPGYFLENLQGTEIKVCPPQEGETFTI